MNLNNTDYLFSLYNMNYHVFVCLNPYASMIYTEPHSNLQSQKVKVQAEEQNRTFKSREELGTNMLEGKKQQKLEEDPKEEVFKGQNLEIKHNNFNKNVLPNTVHLVLSYIRRINKSGEMVNRIIKKFAKGCESYSKKKFYSYQNYLKQKLINIKYKNMLEGIITHLDPSSTVFTVEEQTFYNKISRILIRHFLTSGALLNVLSSKKITRTSKDEHLKIQRHLIQKIKNLR